MDKNVPPRVIVTTRDIQNILSKSERSARDLVEQLRVMLEKTPEQYVTVAEFCRLTEFTEDEARDFFMATDHGLVLAMHRPWMGLARLSDRHLMVLQWP